MQIDSQDRVVLDVPAAFIKEYVAISPEPSILAIDQQVELGMAWDRVRFDCSAIVSVMRGQVDSLELTGNLPFRLNQLTIEETPGASDVDIMRLAPDRYLIVFSAPQKNAFQLRFEGEFHRDHASSPVPLLKFNGIPDVTYRCHLQRDPLLEARLHESDGEVTPAAATATTVSTEDVKLLDEQLRLNREVDVRWSGTALAEVSTWVLETNRLRQPRIKEVLVSFERQSTDWRVSMWVHVSENEPWGLEVLDVEVPEGFVAVNVGSEGRWIEGDKPELRERRRWRAARRVNPGEWAHLEGTLPRFPDGPALPRLANTDVADYRIALPKAQQDDPFIWQYESEVTSAIEDVRANRLADTTEWLVLRWQDGSSNVRLASKPLVVRPTRVHLADYRIQWQQDRAVIFCRFVVDPGGKTDLPLQLPNDFQLKAILIDGELRSLGATQPLQLALVNRELPQEVVVWCEAPAGDLQADDWRNQLLPGLGLTAEVSTLAVMPGGEQQNRIRIDGLEEISLAQWQLYQSQATQRVLEVAPTTTLLSPQVLSHWIENWRGSDSVGLSDWELNERKAVSDFTRVVCRRQ